MKSLLSFSVAFALVAGLSFAGEKITSGLQPGKPIGAFDVVKCSGAAEDGVKVGAQLCYRCKYGARPMVMVFTRNSGDQIVGLAKKLDEAVSKHTDQKLAAFVNLVGDNREDLEATAKKLGADNKLANVPVVVPVEFDNGPGDYGINPKAEVTVILAVGSKVKANHAFAKGEFDAKAVEAVLADVPNLLTK